MNYQKLFQQYNLSGNLLENRFLMAPMTRSRASQPGDIPNALMAEYYAQRSTAGIIITEAVQISLQGKGYAKTPGIYSQQQIEGWKLVTDAVHQNKSKIFLQLWHVGRVSSAQVNGLQPVAPSALTAQNTTVYIFDGAPNGDATFVPVDEPREMNRADIDLVIKEFKNTIIATGNKTPDEAEQLLQENLVDLIGFGRNFLTNPDYPARVKQNLSLNKITDTHTLFGGGEARGYTDYPFLQ